MHMPKTLLEMTIWTLKEARSIVRVLLLVHIVQTCKTRTFTQCRTMADVLFELLASEDRDSQRTSSTRSGESLGFLTRLTSLSLESLASTEAASLSHDLDFLSRTLRDLSKRSYRPIDTAVQSLAHISSALPEVAANVKSLNAVLPVLENQTLHFCQKYGNGVDNAVLLQRKNAMILSDNMERLSDILELPSLLLSTISTSSTSAQAVTGQTPSANAGYASALDLYAHIKRLQRLYPHSELIKVTNAQAEEAMRGMTSMMISSLRSQSLKMAGGMRLVGLLRRIAPDLDEAQTGIGSWASGTNEGSLGALFLVSRFANLSLTLDALEPLRELADQETSRRTGSNGPGEAIDTWSNGQQTERYLKRYIEILREQCFAIISMYKSIFPNSLQGPSVTTAKDSVSSRITPLNRLQPQHADYTDDPLSALPPALASFTYEVVDVLLEALKKYLPNVRERSSRDSLLTQVLYCATSLGRLGADFSMMLADLEQSEAEEDLSLIPQSSDPEWVELVQKHRIQASRLELLASGVGPPRNMNMTSGGRDALNSDRN